MPTEGNGWDSPMPGPRRRKTPSPVVRKDAPVLFVQAMNGDASNGPEGDSCVPPFQPLVTDIEGGEESSSKGRSAGEPRKPSGIRQDLGNILLLLLLYTLQGIPMGLSGSIPFLLQNKVTYSQQAVFSLVSLPFSLKLLWAPLVDSVYYSPFGRRKTWLVPVQLVCGLMMIGATGVMDTWVGMHGQEPHINTLTVYFSVLYLVMATQDIAVDGWALTMLSKDNVGYQSTCNTVGQTVGFFVSQVGFLALNDAGVCNKYLRSEPLDVGMVTLASFLRFWGIVFLGTTVLICFGKKEEEAEGEEDVEGLLAAYKQLVQCMRLPAVQSLCLVLLTCRIAFAVTDAATSLKLMEYGMPKEELAMLSPILVALGMLIPVAIGRLTAGPRPLQVFLWGYPLRLLVNLVYAAVLPMARDAFMVPGGTSMTFYGALIGGVVLHEIASNCMFVAQMAFFAKVSDPVIGGTYMTLLNTIGNLGAKWPNSASLWMLDSTTWQQCVGEDGMVRHEFNCNTQEGSLACTQEEGSCAVAVDGYHTQAVALTAIGVVWLALFAQRMSKLQDVPPQAWHISIGAKAR